MSSRALPPDGPNQDNSWMGRIYLLAGILLLLGLLWAFAGCTPKGWEQLHEGTHRDTVRVVVRDSIHFYDRDSIFIREKGDTVYQYVERWRYRDRWHTDTLEKVKIDSVYIKDTEIREVEKSLSWWENFKLRGFWYLCGALALALAWIFRKPLMALFT